VPRLTKTAWIGVLFAAIPAGAAVSIYVPVERVAERAPIAVEAAVASVASGYDPETGAVSTYVTLAVERSHKGPHGITRIVLRERGGRFGDLVHETDAVPVYRPGERVFAFVAFGPDGAPRTAFEFFGKFALDPVAGARSDRAVRDLGGQGTILGRRGEGDLESFRVRDLIAASSRQRLRARAFPRTDSGGSQTPGPAPEDGRLVPPEYDRLVWDEGGGAPPLLRVGAEPRTLDATRPDASSDPAFAPLNAGAPVRWTQSDAGQAVLVNVEPDRNPLADDAAAVAEVRRAMTAWSGVPESRLLVSAGNENADFTGSGAQSPAKAYPSSNIVLFGDPYGDIADPSGCSGTLAIGGYWRSGTLSGTVNNVSFYPALRLYVIFNNQFECFLGNADNLAEVATHELGHGLGFGHSAVADATMRSYAYGGGRGARLGEDDRDGAHCHYPHLLALTVPNGGESWRAGETRAVSWTSSLESGPDPGTVSLEWSSNGGAAWTPLASGIANDGSHDWTVPNAPGSQNRLRVIRPNRVSPTPAPYPSACSSDASNASFEILPALPVAGELPEGGGGALTVERGAGEAVVLAWGPSCSTEAADYAVYEGSLESLRAMKWEHAPVTCSAGSDRAHSFVPTAGDRYFLAAPIAAGNEGLLGHTSWGPRPASPLACGPRETTGCP
jgi:hypothetical protein